MSQSSTRRWPRLAHLVFLAGYASAAFTLTNFEDITDKVSLKSCRNAYNSPLTNCELKDFTGDNVCSAKCASSIKDVQKAIQKACADVSVDSSSLLSRGQEGQLVSSLCSSVGGNDSEDTTTTEAKKESSKTRSPSVTTSVIQRKTTTTADETSTTEAAQTSLVLAGDSGSDSNLPTGAVQSILPSSSTSSAQASETAKSNGSGRGGDPFATPQNSGAEVLKLGFTTFLISTVVGLVAVM